MDPKNVNILTPRIYEHITCHSERDFEDMIKDFEEVIPVYFGRPRGTTRIWIRQRWEGLSQSRRCDERSKDQRLEKWRKGP